MYNLSLRLELTLSSVKNAFDKRMGEVIELIPDIYDFDQGEYGNNIGDGGEDLFNGGNFLATNLEIDFDYSNDEIMTNDVFGEGSAYFTKKYEGAVFMMAADSNGVEMF